MRCLRRPGIRLATFEIGIISQPGFNAIEVVACLLASKFNGIERLKSSIHVVWVYLLSQYLDRFVPVRSCTDEP